MSAYRENYTPPPAAEIKAPRRNTRPLFVLGVAIAATLVNLAALMEHRARSSQVPDSPARGIPALGAVAIAPVPTAQVTEIRTEAFRAGLAEGVQQGCRSSAAALSSPVLTQ